MFDGSMLLEICVDDMLELGLSEAMATFVYAAVSKLNRNADV